MTIDQAIEILTHTSKDPCPVEGPDFGPALKIALIILIAFNNTLKEVSK